MSKYSSQNFNEVSIKSPVRTTENKKLNENSKESRNSKSVEADNKKAFDLAPLLKQTILEAFLKPNDPLVGLGKFDYVLNVGNHRLFVIAQEENFTTDTTKIPKQVIDSHKQKAATKLTKRLQQLRKRISPSSLDLEDNSSQNEVESKDYIHCIGITLISATYGEKTSYLNHDYGSTFFQEDCVLDLDDGEQVLQIFSLNDFINLINLFQTPSDFISFLQYHLPALVEQSSFANEMALARHFLSGPEFFERAINVQKKLVEIGLLAKVESRLMLFSESNKTSGFNQETSSEKNKIIQKMQSYSIMYQKLVNGFVKRQYNNHIEDIDRYIQTIIYESMYTRMSIMEEIIAYSERSEDEYRNGYLRHQHSYDKFGNHYVLIVYGLDENAEFSRETVKRNYSNIIMDINSQLQDPVMNEYFILGFDMSKNDGKGNVTVEMDVYHQSGSPMTAMEKRLYEQMQELSGNR